MRRLSRWIKEDKEKLVIRHKSRGLTPKQIRELTGFSASTVSGILRKNRGRDEAKD